MLFYVVFCNAEIVGWTTDTEEAQDSQREFVARGHAGVTISDTSDMSARNDLLGWIKGRLATAV